MGLKSLPILNKSGISMYWNNIWDSLKLYKKYNLGFLYLNDVICYFLNENLYYYCIMKIRTLRSNYRGKRGYKHINTDKLRKSWNMRNFYLGKILFFNNQGWVIIVINYFTSRRNRLYSKYKNCKGFRKLFQTFRLNYFTHNLTVSQYKYKF